MLNRAFLKAGHIPTLFCAFFYFDMAFMVWALLGPLGVQLAKALHLDPSQPRWRTTWGAASAGAAWI